MSGFRPAIIKVRLYHDQEQLWRKFLRGEADVKLKPTGYRDGTEGEFFIEEEQPQQEDQPHDRST